MHYFLRNYRINVKIHRLSIRLCVLGRTTQAQLSSFTFMALYSRRLWSSPFSLSATSFIRHRVSNLLCRILCMCVFVSAFNAWQENLHIQTLHGSFWTIYPPLMLAESFSHLPSRHPSDPSHFHLQDRHASTPFLRFESCHICIKVAAHLHCTIHARCLDLPFSNPWALSVPVH